MTQKTLWQNKRVVVTGGAGFLGSFVVERLRQRGCREIAVPRSKGYDLVEMDTIKRLYNAARPDMVIHLAGLVGGIGANQANPGKFFYDNLMMGAQLMKVGRRSGSKSLWPSARFVWILLGSERYDESHPVNLGAGFEISIKDLVELIVKLTGFQGKVLWDQSKPDGQPRRCLDTSKAKKLFGFRARTSFEEGLRRTIEWYQSTRSVTD